MFTKSFGSNELYGGDAMDPRLEEILANGTYCKNEREFVGNNDDEGAWGISPRIEEKVYTYDEAIELTGSGRYNIGLLIFLALAIQSMSLDMFGFSYVVAAAACDLDLSHDQISFLLGVPLMGSIISAYVHGYLSDTRGRKKCLTAALWASFLVATLSALSPNSVVLAVLKFFSSSMSSGVQSMGYTLMGESCSVRTKERYVLILTSALMCCFSVYTAHAYLVLGLDFACDLGFIIFKPWRLLVLTLAMTLGFSAFFMEFFYESPKFLVSVGRTAEALEILRKMKKINTGNSDYPVKEIILLDSCIARRSDGPFLRSLWDQTAPLFQPPLLRHTLLLFYILAVLFSVNNGFYVWMPIIFSSFFDKSAANNTNVTDGFCGLIHLNPHEISSDCTSVVSLETLVMGFIQGFVFLTTNFGAARLAHRKKAAIIFISVFTSACCLAMVHVTEKITTIVLFFGVLLNCIAMGMVFCYIIELFPTRYRGMITSLGVMVARSSGLVGVNLVGAYMFTHCATSLYSWGAYGLSGALMAFLLPSIMAKKS